MMPPVRLASSLYEKVWGVPVTDGLHKGLKLGEIWFTSQPLLLKFLFTSEKLSVQVHPDDSYAAHHEKARGGKGKTEMWYIVDAKPGAQLAIGFRPGVLAKQTREQLRQAALDGSMEKQLNWLDVHPGDAIFVPAGTVHALGPGLTLCEIQQNCDITYRLFDYGRERELHVEQALDVIKDIPIAGRVPLPFSCEYFQVREARPGTVPPGLLVVISGRGTLSGRRVEPREVWRLSEPAELVEKESLQCLLVNP